MKFNEREKYIITKIIQQDFNDIKSFSKQLEDFFFTQQKGFISVLIKDKNSCILYIKETKTEREKKRYIGDFLELINLLKYLESNYLINVIPLPKIPDVTLVGNNFYSEILIENEKCVISKSGLYFNNKLDYIFDNSDKPLYRGYEFKESEVYKISYYILGIICPTSKLFDLFENEWQTEEQIQHKEVMRNAQIQLQHAQKTIKISNITLLVSFLSLGITFCNDTTIPFTQFNHLIEKINEIHSALKAIESTSNVDKNDTIICPSYESIDTIAPMLPTPPSPG